MSWNSKVVWSEGMFMRPQHFQQQERYLEALVENRCGPLKAFDWGFSQLELDRDALALGRVAINAARGVLPDGTPFSIPADHDPPLPLEIGEDLRDMAILLALPLTRPGTRNLERDGEQQGMSRYRATSAEVRDTVAGLESVAPLELAEPRLRLIAHRGEVGEYACMAVARVVERRPDRTVVLDEQYIPPMLDCRAAPRLAGWLKEILGLLHQRGEALGGRVSASGRGVAELADFMLLQLVNRCEPLFAHLAVMGGLHPEEFYRQALQLAGELTTFTRKERRPPAFPAYDHDDLQASFTPVLASIRQSLSMVLEQNAIQIPLEEHKYGIHVAVISDEVRGLLERAQFVLAVNAEMAAEELRRRFPQQVKIGPVEQIRKLVNLQLPGISLLPLPVAPRQLPFQAGYTYFELERGGDYWKALTNSGAFSFHVGGQFPGLDMAFWAVKG